MLWANFLAQSALTFVLLCCFERDRLQRLLRLGLPELGAVAALAGGINWGANLVQQLCIQRLGAPATAAFLPGGLGWQHRSAEHRDGQQLQGHTGVGSALPAIYYSRARRCD